MPILPKAGLGELLLAFRRKISTSTKRNPLKDELSFSQLEALWFVGLSGKKSMEAIASYLKITPPSATALIEKMERKGLVRRERDSADRRVVFISVEDKVKKRLLFEWDQKEKVLDRLVSKLSLKDRESLERIIRKLIEK
jgi:DNA-binding MarR family transcriptional regulator